MPQSKLKLVNTNQVWDAKRRYKINETCTYNSINYQNATGANSEPGVGSDWINFIATPTLQQVTTAGAITNVPTVFSTNVAIDSDIASVKGESDNGYGVQGNSVYGNGVIGISENSEAVIGFSVDGAGVYGNSANSVAGKFNIGNSISNIVEFQKNPVLQAYITHDGSAVSKKVIINTTVDNGIDKLQVAGSILAGGVVNLKNYTVATLPTGRQGDTAYVTDALLPTYLGALTGGGTVKCPVFFNGTIWVSH